MKKIDQNSAVVIAQTGIPVLLVGEPGTGKTSWIRSISDSFHIHLETLIGSIMDPIDIGGLLTQMDGKARYILPDWFTRLQDAAVGMLFIDELTSAPPLNQAGLLRVIAERSIHSHQLPPDILIFAACNPPEMAAGGYDLASPMANRFSHWEFNGDLESWREGMVGGWKTPQFPMLPPDWKTGIPRAVAEITGFLGKFPSLGQNHPKAESERSGPWPSHRTWDYAARAMAALWSVDLDPEPGMASLVGPGPVVEFIQYQKNLDIPDIEAILRKPSSWKVTSATRDDVVWVTLNTAVSSVLQNMTLDRFQAALELIDKAIQAKKQDISLVPCELLIKNKPEGADLSIIVGLHEIMLKSGRL